MTGSTGTDASFLTQLTSGTPVHLPGTSDSIPLALAIGILLAGATALGPDWRRGKGKAAHAAHATHRHGAWAHFSETE